MLTWTICKGSSTLLRETTKNVPQQMTRPLRGGRRGKGPFREKELFLKTKQSSVTCIRKGKLMISKMNDEVQTTECSKCSVKFYYIITI